MPLLLALFGAGIVLAAWLNPEHMADRGRWEHPPAWLGAMLRRGRGPISVMSLSFLIWGLGMTIFGLVATLDVADRLLAEFLLASWVLGGIIVLTVVDVLLPILMGWRSADGRIDDRQRR
jgi:hypothetical protein